MELISVQKPQRYIGNEWNVVKKSHHGKITVCISYPDVYEIGMSNLGLRIIYGLLNDYADVVCERVFMPGLDMADALTQEGTTLFSLETKTALDQFDILAFNLNYELNFTNFLHILTLGNVPLRSAERQHTIVVGGGIANPEPLADFVDVFLIGEFEAVSAAFVEALRTKHDKSARLKALSNIPGFYVPELYTARFKENRYSLDPKNKKQPSHINRVIVQNFEESSFPTKWLTPHTAIVQDRIPLEIARGCPHRCTFCQARAVYYPYRQRSISRIISLIHELYRRTGYENFSLLSLSSSDYTQIEELITEVLPYCQERRIGLALPSLRIKDILGPLYQKLIPLKKTGLTVAVEAAQDSLRERLNKRIDTRELFEAARVLRTLKIRHAKVYFMFGFPEETDEDLRAIGTFLHKLHSQTRLDINASINIFIPKPFSHWEGVGMESAKIIEEKRAVITRHIPRNRRINLTISSTKRSILEAIFSRGGRKLGAVISRAYGKGALFCADKNHFNWPLWEDAFNACGIDYRQYLNVTTHNFPWSFIHGPTCAP